MSRLLAGPIVRRADPSRITIWVATRDLVDLEASVFTVDRRAPEDERVRLDRPIGEGRNARRAKLGEHLWIHLVELRPATGKPFTRGELLAYDIRDASSSLVNE